MSSKICGVRSKSEIKNELMLCGKLCCHNLPELCKKSKRHIVQPSCFIFELIEVLKSVR